MSYLFHNLLHFSRLLHAAGLDVHAGRMPDVAAALSQIDIGRRSVTTMRGGQMPSEAPSPLR